MGNRATFWSSNGDVPVNMAFTNNYSATTNPGAGNDSSAGQNYRRGSIWINTATDEAFMCLDDTVGAAVWEVVTSGGSTPGQVTAPAGSPAVITGGAGSGTNQPGNDVNLIPGTPTGSGAAGVVRTEGISLVRQGAPNAQTVSATLTAANVLTGIITVAQGAGAASALQLPLATAMDTALPTSVAGDAFDFSVINISTNTLEPASLTTNTGWTLVGDMDVIANNATTTKSAGRFRARKTGAGAWTLYRLS